MSEAQATPTSEVNTTPTVENKWGTPNPQMNAPQNHQETRSTEIPKDEIFTKLKTEKDNWRTKATELEAKMKEIENGKLAEQNQFKELYEKAREEMKEMQSTIAMNKQRETDLAKRKVVEDELLKMGLNPERKDAALRFVDMNGVKYDEEHRQVFGVQQVVEQVKSTVPEFFSFKGPRVNTQAPSYSPTPKIDLDTWRSMSAADRKANEAALYESMGIPFRK